MDIPKKDKSTEKSPQQLQAIKDWQADLDLSWEEYAVDNNIVKENDPKAYEIAKMIFKAGYNYGTVFVGNQVATQLGFALKSVLDKSK